MFFVPSHAGDRPANERFTDAGPAGWFGKCSQLRGLLTLTMAVTAAGSTVSGWLARVERQRIAVAAIESLGGAVVYESTGKPYGGPGGWLRTCFGRDAIDDVVAVYLSGTPADDADLACLLNLPRVKTIGLASTPITDAGLPYLRSLERLKHLDLRFTAVSPAAAAALRRALPQAKVLSVSDVE